MNLAQRFYDLQLLVEALPPSEQQTRIAVSLHALRHDRVGDIPKPHATGTEGKVVEDIINRQKFGIAKYGTTVAANPLGLKAWLQHAYEESLDQAVYLKRAMEEIDKENEKSLRLNRDVQNYVERHIPEVINRNICI